MSKKDAAKAREAIDALERNGGNLSKAARELGITRNSLKGRLSGADRVRLLLAIGAEFSVGSPTLAPELSSDTCLCIK